MTQFQSPEVKFIERFGEAAATPALGNDGTVGIVGLTERGPVGTPVRVASYSAFRERFGRFLDDAELAFWMENFFANSGGQGEVYVVRTAHYTDITDKSTLTALKSAITLANDGPGYSLSGTSPAIVTAVGATDIDIALSGEVAQTISLSDSLSGGDAIAAAIQAAVRALTAASGPNQPDYDNFTCVFTEDGRYLLSNGTVGPTKTVVVTDASPNNLADDLNLGLANGGTEDAAPIDSMTIEAESEGIWGDGLSVDIAQTNLVNTELAADVEDGDIKIQLVRQAGVVAGTILEITDTTGPINPQIFVEVDRVEGSFVFLTEALSLTETIEAGGGVRSLDFTLTVKQAGAFVEQFTGLSMNPNNVNDYFVNRINGAGNTPLSAYISVTDLAPPTSNQFSRPSPVSNQFLTGGADGLSGLTDTDFIGDETERNGLEALRDIETLNFVAVPDRPTGAVHQAMLALAAELDRFEVILDPPVGLDANGIVFHVTDNGLSSDYGSIYWPNLITSDPRRRSQDRLIAPSAYILGMRARNANTPGVTVARPPAGREFQAISIVDVEDQASFLKETRDFLFPNRVNPIGGFQGSFGIFAFGTNTLLPGGQGDGVGEVQARAVVLKVKREVREIMRGQLLSQFADEEVLATLQALTFNYLNELRNEGFLIGDAPQTSFFVNFGADLNPPSQLAQGEVKGKIGLRLGRALKFISIDVTEFVPGRNQPVI